MSVTYGDNTTVRDDPYCYLPPSGRDGLPFIPEGRHALRGTSFAHVHLH